MNIYNANTTKLQKILKQKKKRKQKKKKEKEKRQNTVHIQTKIIHE